MLIRAPLGLHKSEILIFAIFEEISLGTAGSFTPLVEILIRDLSIRVDSLIS